MHCLHVEDQDKHKECRPLGLHSSVSVYRMDLGGQNHIDERIDISDVDLTVAVHVA